MLKKLKVGDSAPDFIGKDQFLNPVQLSSFCGSREVMIVFYPFDWSAIPTIILTELRENQKAFDNAGVRIVGISVDSVYSHREWANRLRLKFPIISDFSRVISRDYCVLEDEGCSRLAFFLVDRNGQVRFIKDCVKGEKPPIDTLLKAIDDMRAEDEEEKNEANN